MPHKRVVISGYYGFDSVGDEAILLSLIMAIKEEMADAEITVLSSEPVKTAHTFSVQAVSRSDLFAIVKILKVSDLLISGGGGLFQDIFRLNSVLYYGGLIALAKMLGLKVAIYSQGVGPLNRVSARRFTRGAFSVADLITIRDVQSKELLEEIGVKKEIIVLADPVLGLDIPFEPPEKGEGKSPYIGIAPRDWPGGDLQRLAELADRLISEEKADIILIPMKYPEDLIFAKEIEVRMTGRAEILDAPDPLATLKAISKLDFLIGIPLHSLVMAAKVKVPFLAILYDPKVENFLKLVGREPPLRLKSFSAQEAAAKVRAGLRGERYSPVQEGAIERLSAKAHSAAELALGLLKKTYLLGLKVDVMGLKEATPLLERLIKEGGSHRVITLNTEMAVLAQNDKELCSIINQSDMVLADSFGIKWAARLRAKVTGVDLVYALSSLAAKKGYKVAFFGGEDGVAAAAAQNLSQEYPGLSVIGTYHGFLSAKEEQDMMSGFRADSPDILFVGLGIPKQEKWIATNQEDLKIPLALGIGGSFDVISGRTKRAPAVVQRLNLEWLYRLLAQPKKRFKRVALSLPKFVYLVIKDRF
ncbi:MAG: polysaccharide pyruvyl transferase CsaB [Actinomycetota bacterium]|nr:polysaccharide pyruvyl transferase CsaB [Actinomycetota bacterium]